jgi:hypothetical protein
MSSFSLGSFFTDRVLVAGPRLAEVDRKRTLFPERSLKHGQLLVRLYLIWRTTRLGASRGFASEVLRVKKRLCRFGGVLSSSSGLTPPQAHRVREFDRVDYRNQATRPEDCCDSVAGSNQVQTRGSRESFLSSFERILKQASIIFIVKWSKSI